MSRLRVALLVIVVACGGPRYHSNVNFSGFPAVKMTHPGSIYSTYDLLRDDPDIKAKLVTAGIPASEVDGLLAHSKESGWPSGLATDDLQNANLDKLTALHARRILVLKDGNTLIVAPAAENQGMPDPFRPVFDMYIVIQPDALAAP